MGIHYLPPFVFTQGAILPGWKIKLDEWYRKQLAAGRFFLKNSEGKLNKLEKVGFYGLSWLILGASLSTKRGEQILVDDANFLGPIIEKLRKRLKSRTTIIDPADLASRVMNGIIILSLPLPQRAVFLWCNYWNNRPVRVRPLGVLD